MNCTTTFLSKSNSKRFALHRINFFPFILLFMLFGLSSNLQAQFTNDNLAVFVAAASTSNTTASIVEINTTNSGQSAITTNVIGSTGGNAMRFSGSATSTAYLSNSNDGSLLLFTGANTTNTGPNINTILTRAVGSYNNAGTFNLAATYTGINGNQARSATTLNNTNFFIADQGGIYTNGTTSPSPAGNVRAIKSFGGVVYVGQASSTGSVIQVNTVSATSGGSITGLPGLTNNANHQDFYLVSSGSNGTTFDVLYVISATSNTAGTINKFSLVSGSWTANGSYTTTFGGFGLSAKKSGTGAQLFVSTGQGALTANSVIRLTDTAGHNATINISTGNNVTLYTAASGTIIKGVAFAPRAANPPVINSVLTANGTVGVPFSTYTITATNAPTSYNATNLPGGLSINTTNGEITGTPTTFGVFNVTISATNANGTDSETLVISIAKGSQSITFGTLAPKVVGDAPFALTATSATSGINPITYLSSNTNVATISGNTVTIVAAGTTTITASQAANADYNAATDVPQNLTVTAAALQNQTITFNPLANKTYGDANFALTASSDSGLTVSYSSSNTNVATISGSTVTIVGVGSTDITASQAGNASFNPATNVIQSFTVTPKELTVSGAAATSKVYDRTTTAIITGATLVGVIGGDDVVVSGNGTFNDFNVGIAKPVTTALILSGADATNYSLTQPIGLNATISAAPITIIGAVAQDKPFDGNTNAVITGTLSGVIAPDAISLVGTGTFATSAVGNGIVVTSTSTLSGVNSTNYIINSQPAGLTANITPPVTVLAVGDLSILGFQLNAPDTFTFVTWVDLNPNTYIKFTDNGFLAATSANANNNVRGGEQFVIWRSGSTLIPAGTVISISDNTTSAVTNVGVIVSGNLTGLSASGDALFAYQGAATSGATPDFTSNANPTTFNGTILFGLFAQGSGTPTTWLSNGTASANSSYLPTQLNVANGNIAFGNSTAKGQYIGSRNNQGSFASYKALVNNPANWNPTAGAGTLTFNTTPFVLTTTWDGNDWTNGAPTAQIEAIIEGNYNSGVEGEFTAKKLTVNSGIVTVASGTTLTVVNQLINNVTNGFVVENNGNVIQNGLVNNNAGSIKVFRNASMKRQDYVYWASPVLGQDILAFSPLTLTNRFYELNEVTNAFVALTTTDFVSGKGYSIRAPNTFPNTTTTFNGEFTGIPNNGTITTPITNGGQGFNLIGNPYPSPISADDFLAENSAIGTLYFWAHVQQGAASGANYATYNGTGAAAALGGAVPNGTIQVGQGFLATSSANVNATFLNTMRVDNHANQFFRTASTTEKNRMWFNLSDNNGFLNQALIGYVSDATNELDVHFDGKLIEVSGSKLYSIINNAEYTIQGRSLPFDATDIVNLGFIAAVDGNYTIAQDHVDGLFSGDQSIFLKDNLTGIVHNIKESAYTFASNAGTFNNRFQVVYQDAPLGVENPGLDSNSIIVFKQNQTLTINSGSIVMKSVKVFDVRGQQLFENNKVNATTSNINLNVSNQVLIVQITSEDNKTVSKKVVY